MATIKERLAEFALTLGYRTLSGFEKACGFNKNTITKDYAGLSSTTLTKIADSFPQLNLDWVILGRGSMLVDQCPPAPSSPVQNDIHHNQTVNINYGALKEIIIEAIKEANK